MGDISIIARRLSDGHVQYGWSGNGGYFKARGQMLLDYYTDPEVVEYLFGLGQLRSLWEPGSENISGRVFKTVRTGTPHNLGTTEREIFSKIMFIDYGYFYDLDSKWYYIVPGPLRIKMPLALVAHNLDERGYEFKFIDEVVIAVEKHLLGKRYQEDRAYRAYLEDNNITAETMQDLYGLLDGEMVGWDVLRDIRSQHRAILQYFEDWILVRADGEDKEIAEIVLQKAETPRIETIYW